MLAVNDALDRFATIDARKAELVKLRYLRWKGPQMFLAFLSQRSNVGGPTPASGFMQKSAALKSEGARPLPGNSRGY